MGNSTTKSSLRDAVVYLNISAKPVDAANDRFWSQIWLEDSITAGDIINSISVQEIRMLRDGSPQNFATLTYKMVECLCLATGTLCNTQSQQTAVLNSTRILTRLLPCIFEHRNWQHFFEINILHERATRVQLKWPQGVQLDRDYEAYLPASILSAKKEIPTTRIDIGHRLDALDNSESTANPKTDSGNLGNSRTLLMSLMIAVNDLLFCPEFTVPSHSNLTIKSLDAPPEDLASLDSCEYIWEPGIGYDLSVNSTTVYDKSRIELLRLLLVSLSSRLYIDEQCKQLISNDQWMQIFTSNSNRHALPLFTSLLNTTLEYKQRKLPLFSQNSREELVSIAIRILLVSLQLKSSNTIIQHDKLNLFNHYASRIHKVEDIVFMVDSFTRLLNYRFVKSYLLNTSQHVSFEPELLYLFWWMCNINCKFLAQVMQSKDILKLVVPLLYHMNENFQNTENSPVVHVSVYNLWILSGERNFGVIVNKPYSNTELGNLPTFTGTHADLIVIVVHKLILYGNDLNDLFEPLLAILLNMSPYVKTLSKLASKCLIQMFEIFSSPAVIFTEPKYHQLIVFLLEIFNNLIQYQFAGNSNLVYSIVKRKEAFINLQSLPETEQGIQRALRKIARKIQNKKMNELSNTDKKLEKLTNNTQEKILKFMLPQPAFIENGNPFDDKKITTTRHSNQSNENLFDQLLAFDTNSEDKRAKVQTFNFSDDTSGNILGQQVEESVTIQQEDEIQVVAEDSPENRLQELNQLSKHLGDTCIMDDLMSDQNEIWRPSQDWVTTWKPSLPLQTSIRTIEVLEPQIERMITDTTINQQTENRVLEFLRNVTLVGLLPVPHSIQLRKYKLDDNTISWIEKSTWSLICNRDTLWKDTVTKLLKNI